MDINNEKILDAPATDNLISKNPDRCGGRLRSRQPDSGLGAFNYRQLGATDAQNLQSYPSLTADDLQAAWTYADNNAEEIDLAIQENEQGEEGLVE